MDRAGNRLNARPVFLLLLLAVTYWFVILLVCLGRPLWHDELFTYNFGRMSSIVTMLHDIPKIDLNPPVLYVMEYATLHLAGPLATGHIETITARLPSLVAGMMAWLGVFIFLRRRAGALFAAAGVLCLWQTSFFGLCAEDRPYALLFALLIWLVLAWEKATRTGRNPLWVAAVFLLALSMMGTHFMAVFVLPAFWAAEAARAWRTRKIDLPLGLSLIAPLAIPFAYLGLIHRYGHLVFPAKFQPHLSTLKLVASRLIGNLPVLLTVLVACLIVTSAHLSARHMEIPDDEDATTHPPLFRLRPEDWVLIAGLLLEPLLCLAYMAREHAAFFPRYALPGAFSVVILIILFLFWRFPRSHPRVALTAFLCWYALFLSTFAAALTANLRHPKATVVNTGQASYRTIDPDLPMVVDSGLTYVEMNNRESPVFLNRVYYLTDESAAVKYAHATLFQSEAEVSRIFGFRSHVETLKDFEAQHRRFLVLGTYGYPENWLLRKLEADGDDLRFLGTYNTSYTAKDLYEVTLDSQSQ